jgi:two-component system nitrogen regulation response regulator GlnG
MRGHSSSRPGGPTSDSDSDGSTLSEDERLGVQGASEPLLPALTVLFHRSARRIGERALLPELVSGREVALSRGAPLFAPVGVVPEDGEPLGDPRLSRQPLRIQPGPAGGLRLLVEAERPRVRFRGAEVKGVRDVSAAELRAGGVLELGGAAALVLHLSRPTQIRDEAAFALFGHSHRMQAVRTELRRLATIDAPVLIRGETGTGKELAARALHSAGPRAERPFIAVNLGAVPPTLAAAELFGAERGAFTGAATRQAGYFQQARDGTLFLDEIGEAPPEVQVLLLRALETGEVRPLGAGALQPIRARLVAATDADLESLIRSQSFRAPLLHRLATCEIRLPALRERREDIGPLVLHFLRAECAQLGRPFLLDRADVETAPWLPLGVLAALAAYDWPGNVRQLRNAVRQMVLASDEHLSLQLPSMLAAPLAAPEPAPPATPEPAPVAPVPSRRRPSEISEEELVEALARCRWDLKATAEALGLARPSLYMLLERWPHIRTARDLSADEIERSYRECGGDLDAMADKLRISRSALRRRLRETQLR